MNNLNFLEKKEKKIKALNLIPLINIIFLLLIFFMLAGTIIKKDLIDINPPESIHNISNFKKDVEIIIDDKNNIYIKGDFVRLLDIPEYLNINFSNILQNKILIKIDSDASSHTLIKTINILKDNKINNVSILTKIIK